MIFLKFKFLFLIFESSFFSRILERLTVQDVSYQLLQLLIDSDQYLENIVFRTSECREYGDLHCPRCLAWDHWEDSCPYLDYVCTYKGIQYIGHTEEVHKVEDFAQRRACVDCLGWEPFQEWFYNNEFRSAAFSSVKKTIKLQNI